MRQLKHHEKKLLRKVDLYNYKKHDAFDTIHIAKIQRRYHLQDRNEYVAYNKIIGMITSLSAKLQTLSPSDAFRIAMTEQLITKCYNLGVLRTDTTTSLHSLSQLTVTMFCRRRLSSIVVKLKMAETIRIAITFIEQGQIRVGPNVITNPAFLVTRTLEDYVTWVDSSKIRTTVQKYNNTLDDFDLI
jgi:U3 small nucleolar ribonucleoprotein protein IMP3